jgi:hypothetical protein
MRAQLSTNNPLWQVFNPDPKKALPHFREVFQWKRLAASM